jgi:tRNA threonylcarbamoyladenosine biosynthesis protein TsaE
MRGTSFELVATIAAATAAETRRLGARLGAVMVTGDVVALVGPLGSGKTTFAQGVAEGLEVPRDRHVASPTFALVNEHPGRVPFVHADFYRVERPEELRELGLEEAFDRAAAALEWADRFPDMAPPDHLKIVFSSEELPAAAGADAARRLTLWAAGPRGQRLASALLP